MSNSPSPKPKARRVVGAVALILVVGVLIWINRITAAKTPKSGAIVVPVTMTVATARDVDVTVDALGTVVPDAQVTVTSRVGGTLDAVHFKEGQMVKRGDLLAVIDPRPYAAALQQARGQLERDQAQLANARLDLQRYREAVAQHAVPEQQVAAQQATVQADEGIVLFDRGGLQAAELNLAYTHITSPIDGRVGLRMVDAGNIVPANGTNGLLTIVQLKPISVIFTLPQSRVQAVLTGMRSGRPLRVEAFDRSSDKPIAEGTLLTIDNQIDQATGTFKLKATFPNRDTELWPGEFVTLRFLIGVRKNAITLPERTVQQGPGGDFVFVINPNETVSQRTVTTTSTDLGVAVIERGVAAGEHVVLDGQYRLEDGSRVRIEAPAPASGTNGSDSTSQSR